MIVLLTIAVQIKIVDHKYEVLRRHFSVPIFSFELANLLGANISCTISIDPFKRSVWFEITDGSQDLAHFFYGKLLFGHEKK